MSGLTEVVESVFPRATETRRAVLRAVASKEGHFTAEELCRELPQVGRATIYRTLAHLLREGTLCRVLLEGGTVHYRRGPELHHHHLVCQGCGEVQNITGCGVDSFVSGIAEQRGYEVVDHRLEIYGRCLNCQIEVES